MRVPHSTKGDPMTHEPEQADWETWSENEGSSQFRKGQHKIDRYVTAHGLTQNMRARHAQML